VIPRRNASPRPPGDPPALGPDAAYPIQQLGELPFPLEPREHQPHVVLVVPAYNEQAAIGPAYREISKVMDSLPVSWSIIFVNDGSEDGTLAALDELYHADSRVSYISLSRNFGHQGALAAGLDHAVGDVMLTMDADLQHPPEVIPTLLEAWRQGYDVVHTRKLATRELGFFRSMATRFAYRAIRATSAVEFVAHASDFRLLDAAARDAIRLLPERARLYRGLSRWVGFRQAVVPFRAGKRIAGSTSYGVRQLASLFSRAFFDFSNAPLRVALFLGGATILICMAYLGFVLIAYLVGRAIPPGFVSLIFAFVFLSSVNLTMIGLLGVYVSRIYEEVRARPTYLLGRVHMRTPTDEETSRETR
jgi:glycosyltransferase involved in cell wall biosynthesis